MGDDPEVGRGSPTSWLQTPGLEDSEVTTEGGEVSGSRQSPEALTLSPGLPNALYPSPPLPGYISNHSVAPTKPQVVTRTERHGEIRDDARKLIPHSPPQDLNREAWRESRTRDAWAKHVIPIITLF